MRSMKKAAALAVALILCLSLSVGAWADETTYTITIKNTVEGYTYAAYQIFTGDLSNAADNDNALGTTAVLSNIKWGSDITPATFISELKTTFSTDTKIQALADAASAADVANLLTGKDAALIADCAAASLKTDAVAKTGTFSDKEYVIANLEPGYYLVKNTAVPDSEENAFYSDYILEVVENSTVSPKGSAPTSEKKVKDKNDSTGEESGWQDSADYDIGDDVPFQLKAKLGDNVTSYDVYKVVFHDTLSEGLTYNNDAVVKVGDTVVYNKNGGNDIAKTGVSVTCTGNTLTITIADVTTADIGGGKNSVITVEYTAKLNDHAVAGSTGNTNKMKLEYSNNPNSTGEGGTTGFTPEDTVIVFTYQVIVNKVDGKEQPLSGAEFTLEKFVKDDAGEETYNDVKGKWEEISKVSTNSGTTFTFKGLDDGIYRLKETVTPAGYNTVADMYFRVESANNEDGVTLKSISGTALDGSTITFTMNLTDGSLSTDVVNQSGATLPETGGMGTTVFYVAGGVLAVLAVVLLVTRKRMGAEN